MLARRQSAREMFIEMGGVGHVAGVLTRLGMSPQVCMCVCVCVFVCVVSSLLWTLHTVQLIAVRIKYPRVVKYHSFLIVISASLSLS